MSKKKKPQNKPETVKVTAPQYDCNANKKKLTIKCWSLLLLLIAVVGVFAAVCFTTKDKATPVAPRPELAQAEVVAEQEVVLAEIVVEEETL